MFPYQAEGVTLETTKKIRIVVVDDQAVVRQGFVSLINTVADMEVIAEGTNGQQAIELYREHQPDVMLIDLRMPVLTGVEAIAAIRKESPGARMIVLTTYDGDEDIYRSLRASPGYFASKTCSSRTWKMRSERSMPARGGFRRSWLSDSRSV